MGYLKRVITPRSILFLAVFLSLTCFTTPLFAQNIPSLFNHTPSFQTPADFDQRQRERIDVSVDFSLIRPSLRAESRVSALLPDKQVTMTRKRTKRRGVGNFTWFGRIEGVELSSVVLTVVNDVMYGHVDIDGEAYFIEPSNGGYRIVKHDMTKIPLFENDAMASDSGAHLGESVIDYDLPEDGSRIDVMVLYTQEMFDRYGSAGIAALIQNFIDLTNEAYSESGITTHIQLVHSALYTKNGAAEGVSIGNALDFFTNDTDIADLRDTHKADLVSLLRRYNSGACGVAWVMQYVNAGFADNAYSVVEVRPPSEANPYYCHERTFAHEIGHNLGCAHDRDHAGVNGAYSYSFGYDVPGQFGTIMSYDGPTITRFSTPDRIHNGYPIGKAAGESDSAHNVLTINNTRTTAANFMIAPPPAEQHISVSPVSINFGTLSVENTSITQTITITNNGMQNLVMGTAMLSGQNMSEFELTNDHCSGQTIVPFDSCTLNVVFIPLIQGYKLATLEIRSNDPDTPVFDVSLTGEAAPPLGFSPAQGTIGTILDLNGYGFGIKKPKVYVEYESSGSIRKKNLKVLSYSDTIISARWKGKLPIGAYPLYVKPKGREFLPIYLGDFTIMAPMIEPGQSLHGAADTIVSLTGNYFTSKKPKIFFRNSTLQILKKCRVTAWSMDPFTGESTITFRVPRLTPGEYELTLRNKIDSALTTFTLD